MTTPQEEFPVRDILPERQKHRLQGIESWEQVSILGSNNLGRLIQLAQERANALLAAGESHEDLRALSQAIARLRELLPLAPRKPLLPRLRAESFRRGDRVRIYAADSEGCIAPTDWVRATIIGVEKGYRTEWADGTPNSGYYWRSTAAVETPIFPGQQEIAFSTSEPRVLQEWEYDYLKRAEQDDPLFLDLFAASANRPWCPLWCLERGGGCAAERMDMKSWILHGTGERTLRRSPGPYPDP